MSLTVFHSLVSFYQRQPLSPMQIFTALTNQLNMSTFKSAKEVIASLPELTCPTCCDSFSQEHFPVSIDGCRHVFGVECLKV